MTEVMHKIIVDQDSHGIRLDKYLSNQINDLSRTIIQTFIEEEEVFVNGKPQKASYKVKVDDLIEVFEYTLPTKEIIPVNIPLDIVYEDDDVLVINKPSGLVVHPAPGHYQDTLVNALMYHINSLSHGSDDSRPGIVHRIDKDTSGLLMIAKNNFAHERLAKELQLKKTKREYYALVSGSIKNKHGLIDAPIGRSQNNRLKMNVVASGKKAITHFEVLEQFNHATLLKCRLETGRTHQIRVHMNYIQHPLINDELYGTKLDDFGQYLHAKTLGFTHPRTNQWMEFDSDLPEEFNNYIEKLRESN